MMHFYFLLPWLLQQHGPLPGPPVVCRITVGNDGQGLTKSSAFMQFNSLIQGHENICGAERQGSVRRSSSFIQGNSLIQGPFLTHHGFSGQQSDETATNKIRRSLQVGRLAKVFDGHHDDIWQESAMTLNNLVHTLVHRLTSLLQPQPQSKQQPHSWNYLPSSVSIVIITVLLFLLGIIVLANTTRIPQTSDGSFQGADCFDADMAQGLRPTEQTSQCVDAFLTAGLEEESMAKAEERQIISNKIFKGKVIQLGEKCGWVKPETMPIMVIPFEVEQKLVKMNNEIREKTAEFAMCEDNLVYMRISDVVQEGLVLEPGIQIQFKLYTFNKGVGACEVKSA